MTPRITLRTLLDRLESSLFGSKSRSDSRRRAAKPCFDSSPSISRLEKRRVLNATFAFADLGAVAGSGLGLSIDGVDTAGSTPRLQNVDAQRLGTRSPKLLVCRCAKW